MDNQRRVQFTISIARSAAPLKLVHTDVWGPAPVSARNGARYFMTLIDDFSRKLWIYFMREKSEVFIKFKIWRAEVEKEQGRSVKCLRSAMTGSTPAESSRTTVRSVGSEDTSQLRGLHSRMGWPRG